MVACRERPAYKATRQAASRLAIHSASIRDVVYLEGLDNRLTLACLFTTVWGGRQRTLPLNRGVPIPRGNLAVARELQRRLPKRVKVLLQLGKRRLYPQPAQAPAHQLQAIVLLNPTALFDRYSTYHLVEMSKRNNV